MGWVRETKKKLKGLASYSGPEHWAADLLTQHGLRFNRNSHLFGRFVDFHLKQKGAIIEIDGPYHDVDPQKTFDKVSDRYFLKRLGMIVYRIKNYDLAAIERVIAELLAYDKVPNNRKGRLKRLGLPLDSNLKPVTKSQFLKTFHVYQDRKKSQRPKNAIGTPHSMTNT
jgi:very-short-patch-repair endonuclease